MNDDEYTIENLIKTFGKHHEQVLKDRESLERKVKPGEVKFPEYLKEKFSLALALKVICEEIKSIKDSCL